MKQVDKDDIDRQIAQMTFSAKLRSEKTVRNEVEREFKTNPKILEMRKNFKGRSKEDKDYEEFKEWCVACAVVRLKYGVFSRYPFER